MNAELGKLLNDIEAQRQQILRQVSGLTADRYNQCINGKWSIAQILTHLLTSERLSLGYMKKKSLGVDKVGNSGVLESLKSSLLKASQRLPFLRYKAPKYVIENTPQPLPFEHLNRDWDELRNELRKFLESIEDKNIRKKIYKHPVAGRLDVVQAVTFFHEHIIHHLPQIKRLL
jgi:hypothetical protein